MLKILMMLAVCQFSVSVDPSATMFTVSVDPAALQAKQEEPKATPAVHKKYLAMFTRSACGPCRRWKQNVMPRLQRDGIHVELYDMDNADNYRKYGAKVDRVPAFVVCDFEDGTWYSDLKFGEITEDTAKWMLAGSPKESSKTEAAAEVGPSPPIRYIDWPGWGTIDLETYNRDCNCSMCQTIRVKQRDYQRQLESFRKSQAAVTPDQEGTPHELVESMLDSMELRDSDVVGDLGCGDGRILIAAARRGIRDAAFTVYPWASDCDTCFPE